MNIPISNEILNNFDIINQECLVDNNYYNLQSGEQEYRLYSYLTTFFNNTTILDIGTCRGTSAIALSHNESNNVISYDIVDCIQNKNLEIYAKKNIIFHITNVLEHLTVDFVKNVKIVMIDIDHYGDMEKKMIDKLKECQFSGIIILDDILHHPDQLMNECMKKLWNGIEDTKYDFTKYGHWSGTGIVVINSDITFSFM